MNTVWVYGSTLMPPEWSAWDCIGYTKEELTKKCIARYGRVPHDCVAKSVKRSDVPTEGFAELYRLDHPTLDIRTGCRIYTDSLECANE